MMTGSETSTPAPATLLALATSLATEAGAAIVEVRADAVGSASTKSSPTDPVTEADRQAEAAIVDGILAARPDDGIVGEEGASRTGSSGVTWYIDPIDGTTNYVYGIPAYAVSVAAAISDQMAAAVVFNPVTDELYTAAAGAGAALNGEPISVSAPDGLAAALIATGFGYRVERRACQAGVVAELLPLVRDIRRSGSAALDLCAVAAGRVDAYYEAGLGEWDYAAGALIAIEAGARCDNLRDGPGDSGFLIASSPAVHGPLGDTLRRLDADRC